MNRKTLIYALAVIGVLGAVWWIAHNRRPAPTTTPVPDTLEEVVAEPAPTYPVTPSPIDVIADALPRVDYNWRMEGRSPVMTHDGSPARPDRDPRPHRLRSFTHSHWSLRYDASAETFRRRLQHFNHDIQTFTEAPNFERVMHATKPDKFGTVAGGREAAIRYRRDMFNLESHRTYMLYPHPYGWNLQIRNVSALIAYFDTLTVAVLHTPAHTGRGKEWQDSTQQEASSSEAYRATLFALPGMVDALKSAGKPILFAGDWNKPLYPGYWKSELEKTLRLKLTTHAGVCGDFVADLRPSGRHPLAPALGFDHRPYALTYKVIREKG